MLDNPSSKNHNRRRKVCGYIKEHINYMKKLTWCPVCNKKT